MNTGRLLTSKRNQVTALALIAGVLLLLLFQTFLKAYRADGYDFSSYLLSAQALLDGGNPYKTDTPFPYIYPLFLAFALIPLAVIPYWTANVVWFVLSVSGLFVSCLVLVKMAESEIKTTVGWHLAVPGLLVFAVLFSPIQNNLLNGQVNSIVLICCVMFFHSFIRQKPMVAALWLAAAISMKLFPAFLLLFLLTRRQYHVLLATVLFTAMFCLLPGVAAGGHLIEYYKGYVDSFLLAQLGGGSGGQSGGPIFSLWQTIRYFVPSAGTGIAVQMSSVLVSVVAVLAIDLASLRSSRTQRVIWSFCAYLVGFVLISPMAETHHLIFVVPAVFLLVMRTVFDRGWATKTVLSLGVCYVGCVVVLSKVVKTTPIHFVSLVVLLILLALANTPALNTRRPYGIRSL